MVSINSQDKNLLETNKVIVIAVVLLFIDILVQGFFINKIDFISPQDAGFLNFAREIVSPEEMTEADKELTENYKNHTPLYPLISGIIYILTGNLDRVPAICYVIFSAALIIPVFLISLRVYGKETAIISSLLLIFIPALSITIYYSLRHVIFNFFLYLSLYFILIAYLDKKTANYALGGFFLGMTYLARGEGLIVFLVICLVIILMLLFEKKLQKKHGFKIFIIFIGGFLICFIPHILYVYNSTGQLSFGGDRNYKYYVFTTGQGVVDNVKGDTDALVEYGYKIYGSAEENNNSIFNAIKKNPKAYISRIIKNFKNLLDVLPSTLLIPFFLYPFCGLALIELLNNDEQLKVAILFISVVMSFVFLLTIIYYVQTKLLTPIVPIVLTWAAYGIKKTQDAIREQRLLKFAYLPLVLTILPLAIIFYVYIKPLSENIPREMKNIGEWIKANTLPSDMIVIQKEWYDEKLYLQYYSRRKVRKDNLKNLEFFRNTKDGDPVLIVKNKELYPFKEKIIYSVLKVFSVKNKKIVIYEAS